jgi:uncharacterized protein (TIGR03437 family)
MTNPGFPRLAAFSSLLLLAASGLDAQQPGRIAGALENGRRTPLAGRVRREARPQNDLGRVEAGFELPSVTLHLQPTPAAQSDLAQLLREQQDPASPNYHKWLTPEQFGERFGATESDLKQMTAWLESQGLTVVRVARGRNFITVSGAAGQVSNAFQTEIHRYNVNGVTHFANATDPTVPTAMAGMVATISGLNDFRLKARSRKMDPRMTSGSAHHLAPDDIATIYNIAPLLQAGVDGTGQKIVVVGQTAIRPTDVNRFRSNLNLPPIDLQQQLVGRRSPGVVDGDVDEAHLDIEWAGAVARNASIIYVYSQDVWTSAQYAVDQNLAPVITMSYGGCEGMDLVNLSTYQRTAQQANAEGITWFAASGDSGAGDCEDRGAAVAQNGLAVDAPSSIPEITGMGGTMFDEQGDTSYWSSTNTASNASALKYIPERVWNDSSVVGELSGGGGGASIVFPRPSWQTGPGVPNDGYRHTPDLSLSSSAQHVGYYVYSGGVAYFGGTSVAAPVMAGIASLLNQYLVSTGAAKQPGLGNINPTLYRLAQTTTGVFHDIVNGDNTVPCAAATPDCVNGSFGHKAGPGYDNATGLGSVDANALVHQWSSRPAVSSAVTASIDSNPVFQNSSGGWKFVLTLTEEAGIGTRLTDFTVDGVSRASEIPALFGTANIAPSRSISATVTLSGFVPPKNVVLGFSGVDTNGLTTWTTQMSVPFKGPQTRLTVAGVSNAASGDQVYAPGMILSVYGAGMGNFAQAAAAIPLPQFLAGFEAYINGVPAPLYYVSPNQVNIQIPYETQPGSASLVLGNPFENVTYRFTVSSAGPGIFTFSDGSLNPSRSAARGQVATLFVTGEGQVSPTLATGTTPSARTALANLPKPRGTLAVTVGGVPATVQFAGIPSGLVGVTQINFTIPAGVGPGVQPVVVSIGGTPSNTATITVQ